MSDISLFFSILQRRREKKIMAGAMSTRNIMTTLTTVMSIRKFMNEAIFMVNSLLSIWGVYDDL